MVLTERQKKDLNKAILEYLISEGSDVFSNTIEAFIKEGQVTESIDNSGKNLLEKKWVSVVRLQKRVMELEAQILDLQKNGNSSSSGVSGRADGISADIPMTSVQSKALPKGPPKSTLCGHRGPVTTVTIHPIYFIAASGSEDSTIKLWDYESYQYERTLKGHTGPVTGLDFNATGTLLASSSGDMSAKLWDMTTFTCSKTLRGHDHTISSIKFMPSSDYLITCSRDRSLKCWEVNTGYCIRTFTGHSDWVKCLSVSLDGEHVASGGTDQTILIWKFSTGQCVQTLRGHEHVVESVCYGKKPLTAANIMKASTTDGAMVSASIDTITASASRPVEVSSEEYNYLCSGSRDRSVKLWDSMTGQCLMTFNVHDNWVRNVIFHPNGKYIISCSDDKSIRVFDVKENRCFRTIADAHSHFVSSIAISSINPVLVSGSVDKNISIWNCS